jgi:hypothetical protein
MRASDPLMKKILLPLLVALLAFIGLDALVFRSGLYSRELSPSSIGGAGYYTQYFEKRRPADSTHDVLMTGDSRMGEGFSSQLANGFPESGGYHFVQEGIPGSDLRVWYYLLKDLDPAANRYRAIVLSVSSFRHVLANESAPEDRILDADILGPIIPASDFLDLANHYPTPSIRGQVWARTAIAAANYRMDFQDFLLHPVERISLVKWRRKVGSGYASDYTGHPESMEGLAMDPATHALTYPERLSPAEREAVERRFNVPPPGGSDEQDNYIAYWLARICERYAHSGTTVVLVRMPASPLPAAFQEDRKPLANFLTVVQGRPNVVVVPETTFLELESPGYFFDTNHLNALGRKTFTRQVVDTLPRLLPGAASRQPNLVSQQ